MTTSCAQFPGASLNFTVNRSGIVVVSAVLAVDINKFANGTFNYTTLVVALSNSSGDCLTQPELFTENGATPNGFYYGTLTLVRSWVIPGPGTYSFYVDGYNEFPASGSGDFGAASVLGEYFPS